MTSAEEDTADSVALKKKKPEFLVQGFLHRGGAGQINKQGIILRAMPEQSSHSGTSRRVPCCGEAREHREELSC